MENKILFYQSAAALPAGLSLADYEYRFYKDNAGKTILTVEITGLADDDVIAYDSATQKWVNKAGVGNLSATSPIEYDSGTQTISLGAVTWGDLLGPTP